MTTIQAWQHIYSNVEKEQSPTKRGGFQTLFYTKAGLTEEDISEMEGRLLYFPSDTAEPVKRLFFTTRSGKGVVAQITPLPEPDQFGRKGRYLAHALAFPPGPEGVAKFEADPFRVFRHFYFFTTVAEALAQGDFKTGDIPPVSLDLPPASNQAIKAAQSWAAAELKKLALLALRVEQQTRERQAITFTGEPKQIEQALEAAFLAVPVAVRPCCTFDTYFYRCNLVATFYWVIGLQESPVSLKFALVEAQARQVRGNAPAQPETAYERWVVAHIETKKLADIAQQRDPAFALGEWLDQREYEAKLLKEVSPALLSSMFEVNPQTVQALLRRRLGEVLPNALVERAADHLYQQTNAPELYRQLRQGFETVALLRVLYQSYEAQKFAEPSRAEVKALDELLTKHEHGLLRLFVAYWRSTQRFLPDALTQTHSLPEALTQADEADYRQFGQIALRLALVEPLKLLIPQRGDAFLDLYLAYGIKDWVKLVEALIETEQMACLARLSEKVSKLSPKELRRIDKLVDEQEGVPESFRTAVTRAIAALPPEKGIKGFIRAARRHLPGSGEE